MSGPYSSLAVANKILDIAKQKSIKLTMMQLLKLVYISHGWWLTFSEGKPLTSDTPQAWQYGPVYPEVYKAFRGSGSSKITRRAVDPDTGLEPYERISEEATELLEQVVDAYGNLHAYVLSDMTHEDGTPWSQASKEGGYYAPIPNSLIKEHFDDLRKQRTAG